MSPWLCRDVCSDAPSFVMGSASAAANEYGQAGFYVLFARKKVSATGTFCFIPSLGS